MTQECTICHQTAFSITSTSVTTPGGSGSVSYLRATAANNVYVKLSCENNTTLDITLKQQEQVGWADLSTPNGTRRAKFFMGAEDNDGVNSLTFSSLGIAFNINYTADKKFTLKMISSGSGE
ncbi:hypothetical protein N8Q68_16420 [Enterobacter hormaechei subsp. hoffmannii]|uniref:hypothetical protein n=1 Tax=Enterobacter hormaechei TaxID=158836 RepID=UPI000F82B3A2|nr:hypothetical protein [Enterobacter hormaechei]MCU2425998.1 hypothetical protein [Enterobacter hormaechei subsp. hoffmannii]ELC7230161.1 hypothetical protein [Enterobacter hormaechei]MBJ6500452.1 hypothetical protein [Enterobacter hormaechei]MCU2953712.1 hypothetical protein [Enterobacter hormaechei subsp. hoffmannii]MCU3751196.1 hypothetical protein [Enterobacter hormaechei subsp. hoffmannii]